MKITYTRRVTLPQQFAAHVGETRELEDWDAQRLIDDGYAVAADGPPAKGITVGEVLGPEGVKEVEETIRTLLGPGSNA